MRRREAPGLLAGAALLAPRAAAAETRYAADLTARIFGGAKPGNLPFEEPTHYPLPVNLKVAKAAGINLPNDSLALAHTVIE